MSEILPGNNGEDLPDDFEERLRQVNEHVNNLLDQGYREGKSLNGSEDGEDFPIRIAVFSASLQRVVEVSDAFRPIPARDRMCRIYPCTKDSGTYQITPPTRDEPYYAMWHISEAGEAQPQLFIDDHEKEEGKAAINRVLEIIEAEDSELVAFREVFPDNR